MSARELQFRRSLRLATAGFFCPADVSPTSESAPTHAAEIAYTGLVKMYAHELHRSERFRRLGRMTPNEVHAVARDLDKLDRAHELDATIELILARTDALHLQGSS